MTRDEPVGWSGGPLLHPLHAILLAFPIALFASAVAADLAYLNTAEMQWSNFAAWLISGAMVFGAVVLIWSAIRLVAGPGVTRARTGLHFAALAVMCAAGLVNAFQHSRDAWSSVGALGLSLSIVSTLAALLAGWIGYSAPGRGKVIA